jgi:DNA-binding beta-propeller fold protein YncE
MKTRFLTIALIIVSFSCGSAFGQTAPKYDSYSFKTLAGALPGSADGKGVAARFQDPEGLAVDASGNVYVADQTNYIIRKITPAGEVSTIAGVAGLRGYVDGKGAAARFQAPTAVAIAPDGSLFVSDAGAVRKIDSDGVVTTFAGGTAGTGSATPLGALGGIAVETAGTVYVTDDSYNSIRKITSTGEVSTLAGGSPGFSDGQGSAAAFLLPTGLTVLPDGTIFVADTGNSAIRVVSPDGYTVTFHSGPSQPSIFSSPRGVAVDPARNVYVSDSEGHVILKFPSGANGAVETYAGSSAGSADGPGSAAQFLSPGGLALDAAGNLYVSDSGNTTVRKIDPTANVSTLAGLATGGSSDGAGGVARFTRPRSVAVDAAGNVYVADSLNSIIRKITPDGTVSTLAGLAGQFGNVDGGGADARFSLPKGIAVDAAGNVYVADTNNNAIRKITSAGQVSTLAKFGDFYALPEGIAVDAANNLYVAGTADNIIFKVTPDGQVMRLAGSGHPGNRDGQGFGALFNRPAGIAVDGAGNVFVAENRAIRKVTPDGTVSTITSGSFLTLSRGVAVDAAGMLYVAGYH